MPHVRATPSNLVVALDNGVSVTPYNSINVDVTLPLAAAALTAGKIVQLDSVAAPVRTVAQQTVRTATQQFPLTTVTRVDVQWPKSFGDLLYTMMVSLVDETVNGNLTLTSPAVFSNQASGGYAVSYKTAAGFTVYVWNVSTTLAQPGHIEAVGWHD